jgi:hypothetical protein
MGKKMSKQLKDENLKAQHQETVKLQDIEENSVDQLFAQPIPEFKETLNQQDQENASDSDMALQNKSKVCIIRLL